MTSENHGVAGLRPFDLHAAFSVLHASDDLDVRPLWRPIDVNVVTPWHWNNERVPGMFLPRSDGQHPIQRGRGRGRGRGYGRGRGRGRRGGQQS
jgi:hypothetical protein